MITCSKCGGKNQPGGLFCQHCGWRLVNPKNVQIQPFPQTNKKPNNKPNNKTIDQKNNEVAHLILPWGGGDAVSLLIYQPDDFQYSRGRRIQNCWCCRKRGQKQILPRKSFRRQARKLIYRKLTPRLSLLTTLKITLRRFHHPLLSDLKRKNLRYYPLKFPLWSRCQR